MMHIYDLIPDPSGDVRHMLFRGCDGSLVLRTRPFEQTEADFVAQWPPTKPECCASESRTYVCSDLRVLSRAAGSSGRSLVTEHFIPLDLAARLCWPRRKHWDILRLLRDFGTLECSCLYDALQRTSQATESWLCSGLETDNPARERHAAAYATCLHQVAEALCAALKARKVFIEDELELAPVLRDMETNPRCHLQIDRQYLLTLMGKRDTFEGWSTTNRAIASAAGVKGSLPPGGLLGCSWTQFGTWTGRVTASNPPMQAVGEDKFVDMRRLFQAQDGHTLISCDWRKAELQALAKLTGKDKRNTTSWSVYEPLPPKVDLFRILYGGGTEAEIEGLPPLLRRSLLDIRYMMMAYNMGTPDRTNPLGNMSLPAPWCHRCPPVVGGRGQTCKLCGRKREPEDRDPSTQVNWMLQASVAGAMRTMLPCLAAALSEHGAHPVLLRHDEVVIQAPVAKVSTCQEVLVNHMSFTDETLTRHAQEIDNRWGQWDVSCSTGKTLQELSK